MTIPVRDEDRGQVPGGGCCENSLVIADGLVAVISRVLRNKKKVDVQEECAELVAGARAIVPERTCKHVLGRFRMFWGCYCTDYCTPAKGSAVAIFGVCRGDTVDCVTVCVRSLFTKKSQSTRRAAWLVPIACSRVVAKNKYDSM